MRKQEKQSLQKIALFSDLLLEELDFINQIRRNANRKPTEHFNRLTELLEHTVENVYANKVISDKTTFQEAKNKTITFLSHNLKEF